MSHCLRDRARGIYSDEKVTQAFWIIKQTLKKINKRIYLIRKTEVKGQDKNMAFISLNCWEIVVNERISQCIMQIISNMFYASNLRINFRIKFVYT